MPLYGILNSMKDTFSADQNAIIIGSLLGDGHLTCPRYGHSAFVKNQCEDHAEYLEWHKDQFGTLAGPVTPGTTKADGKTYHRRTLRVYSHPYLTSLRREWYKDNRKVIPPNLALTPLSLAIWFFDDGSNVVQARRATFATYCFSREEVELLKKVLESTFGISCTITTKNVLTVRANSYKKLVEIISPFMQWKCFKHKTAFRESSAHPSCKEQLPQVAAWHRDGKSIEWIANKCGVSRASVYNQLIRYRKMVSDSILPLHNTSGIKGVCYDKSRRKWVAHLTINGHRRNLGRFDTLDAASDAIERSLSLEAVPHSST